jgi:RNA polymerase sigma-70 factor (ECF subfamily)
MDSEECSLILRAQQGDHRAFAALVTRCDRRVLGLAFDMTGHVQDAQDIYQEALLAAYRALPTFRMDSEFSTWLYRIAINKARRFRCRRKRRPPPEEWWEERAGQATPEDLALKKEFQAQLHQALAALSPQERLAFVLCHHQGLKIDQAAELMECSSGSVKSYLFRGREKLRRALRDYLEG